MEQLASFIFAGKRRVIREVHACKAIGNGNRDVERAGDRTRQQQGYQDANQNTAKDNRDGIDVKL
ncbi:hypothetical protein D9M71_758220 [compost metagenome]